MVAIVGASGVGKSTLLHVLGGLDRPDARHACVVDGRGPRRADRRRAAWRSATAQVGFVFQFHHLLPEFTALENARCRCASRGGRAAEARAAARGAARRASGLGERLDHRPGDAVGRRAAARGGGAGAGRCSRRCSWPTSPPATSTRRPATRLHALLREMHRERGLTSVIATHNPRLAAACDRVLRLEGGRAASRPDRRDRSSHGLRNALVR